MSSTQPSSQSQEADLKIILLGDSAVGKSKLAERFLLDDFHPQQLSTYALTLYRHTCTWPFQVDRRQTGAVEKQTRITVDFWDTAGQERFLTMHPSYYHGAHACILVFDMGRKVTYKNLDTWYDELVGHRGTQLPVIVVANKIDVDASRARKSFGFVDRRRAERAEAANQTTTSDASEMDHLPLFFSSASDGTNVVSIFREAINRGMAFKKGGESGTFVDEVLAFIREEEGKGEGGMFKKEVAAEEDKSEAKETREASGTAEVTGAPSPSSGLPASRSNIAAA